MNPLSPPERRNRQLPSLRWYWTWKRMNSSLAPLSVAGIEPRIPTVSGLDAVSHTLTVAQGELAEAAAGAVKSSANAHARVRWSGIGDEDSAGCDESSART